MRAARVRIHKKVAAAGHLELIDLLGNPRRRVKVLVRMSVRVARIGLAGAAIAASLSVLTPSSATALTVELKDVASDRVERQRAFAEGRLPLPGTPNLGDLSNRLASAGLALGAPMFIRILKEESLLEIWMLKGGKFVLFSSYPMCHWSGTLGPKIKEGDRQNPEGFYSVTGRQLHRVGRWPRSLNLGFPNNYDRAFGRTGSYILVHGGCSSTGCFAMTNAVIEEIYNLTEAAIKAGQERVHVHVYPFRMTDENLERYKSSEWHPFWVNLKEGYDAFEATHVPPRVGLCNGRYLVQNVLQHDGPEEVADPGPLASCGASHAATPRDRASYNVEWGRNQLLPLFSNVPMSPSPVRASRASGQMPATTKAEVGPRRLGSAAAMPPRRRRAASASRAAGSGLRSRKERLT
jgi:murein L,D-transpeptidase YafK